MARWSTKDANGKELTDGRLCYVIDNPTDSTMPPIFIYGKDKDEILTKAARTIETAQTEIHRLRKPAPVAPALGAPAKTVSDADVAAATVDLANPSKAASAVKTILKSSGIDLDKQAYVDRLNASAKLAHEWEQAHDDYPKDPRNDRILAKLAASAAGGFDRLTVAHLDAAFAEMREHNMLFEPEPPTVGEPGSRSVQPRGTEDSRTVREATSYRRNALRSPEPPVVRGETAKEKEWRNILENGNSRQLRNALESEPGFKEWADKQGLAKTA